MKAAGIRPDIGYAVGWDGAQLFVGALRKYGFGATPEQIRDYIGSQRDYSGAFGKFDFVGVWDTVGAYGGPIDEIRRAHLQAAEKWSVFGVPTFVVDGRAVFVRLMSRPQGDAAFARRTIEGIVTLMAEQPDLNEFKYTTLER